MAGEGKNVRFHGAFRDKARAVQKENEVSGFIVEREIRGARRFVFLTRKGKSSAPRGALSGGAFLRWLLE